MTEPKLDWQRSADVEDELSKRHTFTAKIETPEQAQAAALLSQQDEFWPRLEALAGQCDARLAQLGFPGADEMVAHDKAGKWWRVELADLDALRAQGRGFNLTRGANLAKAGGDLSEAWYAGEIGFLCREALAHQDEGSTGEPFLLALIFQIATLRTDWRWRHGFKKKIITERKIAKGNQRRREGQNANAQKAVEKRRECIRSIVAKTTLKGGALAQHIKKCLERHLELTVSVRTIRRDLAEINRAKAKKLGQAS